MPHRPQIAVRRVVWVVTQTALWVPLLVLLVLSALPRLTPYDVLVVRGGSMEPTIPLGSAVIVDRADRTPRLGAVTTFTDPGGALVTHRIVALDGAKIVTKGDANQARDVTERAPSDVVGTVVVGIPFLGYVLYTLRLPLVFFLLLAATGGFLIAGQLKAIVREIRRLQRPSTA